MVGDFVRSQLPDVFAGSQTISEKEAMVFLATEDLEDDAGRVSSIMETVNRTYGQVNIRWACVRWNLAELDSAMADAMDRLQRSGVAISRAGINIGRNRVEIAVDWSDVRKVGALLGSDDRLTILAEGRWTAS
jgi:hypothetical protein